LLGIGGLLKTKTPFFSFFLFVSDWLRHVVWIERLAKNYLQKLPVSKKKKKKKKKSYQTQTQT